MEYTTPFDAASMAASIVDGLRETTDASMEECVRGAENTCRWLATQIQSSELAAVMASLARFEVDDKECRDAREMRALGGAITNACGEIEELSYSSTEATDEIIEMLIRYTQIIAKTDLRVVNRALCDVEMTRGLADVFIKEQNRPVAAALADSMVILCKHSKSIAAFLVESPLLMNVVSRLENSPFDNLSEYHSSLLSLVTAVMSSDLPPPIDTIQYLNRHVTRRLWSLASNGYEGALETLVQIFRWRVDGLDGEGVIESLIESPLPNLGERIAQMYNRDPSRYKFELLNAIFENKELVEAIFYSNDIPVLLGMCGRHLLNEEDEEKKRSILRLFVTAGSNGFRDGSAADAVSRCEWRDSLVEEAAAALSP